MACVPARSFLHSAVPASWPRESLLESAGWPLSLQQRGALSTGPTHPCGAGQSPDSRGDGNADLRRLRSGFKTLRALACLQTILPILALDMRKTFIKPRTLMALGYQENTQGLGEAYFCTHHREDLADLRVRHSPMGTPSTWKLTLWDSERIVEDKQWQPRFAHESWKNFGSFSLSPSPHLLPSAPPPHHTHTHTHTHTQSSEVVGL